MPTTNKPFAPFIRHQFDGSAIDWDAITARLTLHDSSIVPDRSAHDFFNDLAASELSTANGYTQGGKVVDVLSVAWDAATRQVRLLASNPVVWNPITKTFRYAVLRRDTGNAATSDLLNLIDLEADSAVDGILTFTFDATGVTRLTLPA